jgi:flagellar motor switch protein FliN
MNNFLDCWISTATALFSQALVGEAELEESLPKPLGDGSFGFAATITGDEQGRFAIVLDAKLLEAPLMGEGADQKAGWKELLHEVVQSACGEILAKHGKKCKLEAFEEISAENKISRAFQLKAGDQSWTVLVHDEVRVPKVTKPAEPAKADPVKAAAPPPPPPPPMAAPASSIPESALSAGVELLLDVELDAALRFGCREMPLGDILDLGPGDVVQLDRHVSDPVDLIVGDKIVARGEVVLANGNFALRVTEVASPKKRLESIRCLF